MDYKPLRIAVAADQPIFRRGMVSLIMSQQDMQIVGEATNCEEAVQLCSLVLPDVLILDFHHQISHSMNACRAILNRWPKIKIIHMSSLSEKELGQIDLDEGSAYVIQKEISEQGFVQALRHITRGVSITQHKPSLEVIQDEYLLQMVERLQAVSLQGRLPSNRDLMEIIQSLAVQLSDNLNLFPEITRRSENGQLSQELIMAGRIQSDILPDKEPMLPGWDISARLTPARETSGDFYDFLPLANNHWGFVIADVTDKGMGAALFMALSNTLVRTYAVNYPTLPAFSMGAVNKRILSDTRGSMFVTAFYAVLDPSTGRIHYVNAGHPPPLLVSAIKGRGIDLLRPTGKALGIIEDAHWTQKIVKMTPGDVLLMYTDGVTEAQNPQGSFFGQQRLIDFMRSRHGQSASHICDELFAELQLFTSDSPRQDDIALVVLKRTG